MVNYPKDWEDVKIEDIISIQPFIKYIYKDESKVGKYPIIQQGDDPIFGYSSNEPYFQFDYSILFGDHTLSLYKPNKPFLLKSDGIKILKCSPNSDRDFLYYLLKKYMPESQGYKRHYSILKRIEVFLPLSKVEQKAIAETLMAFDKHIENLSKLIEKKKMIRDGAVEDLVSGKKRLSNFSGKWDYKPVKSITKEVITGGTPSTNIKEYWGGSVPWLASTEIHQKNIKNATKNISCLGLLNSSAKIAPKGSVLIALAGQGKTRGTAAILGKDMAINQSLAALVCNEDNYYKFLFYAIEMNYEALRELSSGDGGRGGLNKKLIKDFKINTPLDKNEQITIANILSSMDKEIENLEKEKEKYIQLKSGAMDDLLTGKIRLV